MAKKRRPQRRMSREDMLRRAATAASALYDVSFDRGVARARVVERDYGGDEPLGLLFAMGTPNVWNDRPLLRLIKVPSNVG